MKYKIRKDLKIEVNTMTLYRIEALKDFGEVKAGDLGGYVQGEHNLSQEGDCWVHGDARVYGNAWVYGDARVYGNARVDGNAVVDGNARVDGNAWVSGNAVVYGNARVDGNAVVYGNARVDGNAWVSGNAVVYGNARVNGGHIASLIYIQGSKNSLNMINPKELRIGCIMNTLDKWEKDYEKIGKSNGYTKEEIKEYYEYIQLIKRRQKYE